MADDRLRKINSCKLLLIVKWIVVSAYWLLCCFVRWKVKGYNMTLKENREYKKDTNDHFELQYISHWLNFYLNIW